MTDGRRRRRLSRLVLLAYAALCGAWLLHLDYRRKISTNVLDLMPSDARSPELSAVRDLADNVQARVVLFAVTVPGPGGRAAARKAAAALAAALRRSPAFAAVDLLAGDSSEERLGRAIYGHRESWLLPTWLGDQQRAFARTGLPAPQFAAWTAERSAARLEAFLARPEAMPLERLLASDPLLLMPSLIDKARALGSEGGGSDAALVWTRIAASPLSEAGQGPVEAAVAAAIGQARAASPAATVRWTGVNRFAAASRTRIEHEIKLLNTLSLAAVLLVGCIFVQRLWKLAHLVPVVLCSLLGAWTVSTLVFARLHILVFAIGSLLSGVAIDYGFYIFMQPYANAEEEYPGKLRRLLKPLLASCLTTVAGFSLLLFSDLPLIRQVGLFVSAGLLSALGAAMLYFGQLRRPFLEGRRFPALARQAGRPGARAAGRGAAILAAIIAVAAPWRLHWKDDVRELDLPQPALQENDRAVRALFGDSGARSAYLTYGSGIADARENLARFLDYLSVHAPSADPFSLGLILPSRSDYEAMPGRLAELRGFPAEFRAALARHGFLPDSFSPFFVEWRAAERDPPRAPYGTLFPQIEPLLTGPLSLLASPGAGPGSRSWFVTLAQGPELPPLPPALHTVSANELQNLNGLFTQYRWSALRLSLIGLALVIASVFVIYPFPRAIRIALIPAGSCFFVFGLLGLLGQTLNLFHLLGAFLGVCLAHNYSIFSSDTARSRSAPPVPVRLSGLCAAASFGVLATSHIPVVHALGLTVCLIVLTALASVEIEGWLRSPVS